MVVSKAETSWQKAVVEESCSTHGSQEAERAGRARKRETFSNFPGPPGFTQALPPSPRLRLLTVQSAMSLVMDSLTDECSTPKIQPLSESPTLGAMRLLGEI